MEGAVSLNDTLTELHNRRAGQIVREIVKPTLDAGGTPASVLVLLESVTAGTIHALTKIGGDEIVLDLFMKQVSERLALLRLGPIGAKGSA
jgi:hypothetical protein